MNQELKNLLTEIDNRIEQPFVTPKFGDRWKENAKENFDLDVVINIAWKQGRRALLLEQELSKLMPTKEEINTMAGKYAEENEGYYKHSDVKTILFNAFIAGKKYLNPLL